MTEPNENIQRLAAILTLLVSLAASLLLAGHWNHLRLEALATQQKLDLLERRTTLATLDSVSLPPNRTLSICNDTAAEIAVSALTAIYWDSSGRLRTFNSAKNQWHTWRIAARTTQPLKLTQQNSSVWDGSAVFYAMDLVQPGRNLLLSGTSDDLRMGCIRIGD